MDGLGEEFPPAIPERSRPTGFVSGFQDGSPPTPSDPGERNRNQSLVCHESVTIDNMFSWSRMGGTLVLPQPERSAISLVVTPLFSKSRWVAPVARLLQHQELSPFVDGSQIVCSFSVSIEIPVFEMAIRMLSSERITTES
jgi:hypothetical protein